MKNKTLKIFVNLKKLLDANSGRAGAIAGWYQQASSAVGSLVIIPTLIQSLGLDLAGIWLSILAMIAIFSLTDFGFSTAIARQITHTLHKNNDIKHLDSDFLQSISGWNGVTAIYLSTIKIFNKISILMMIIIILSEQIISHYLSSKIEYFTYVYYCIGFAFVIQFKSKIYQAMLDGIGYLYVDRLFLGTYQLVLCILSFFMLKMNLAILGLAIALLTSSILLCFFNYYVVSNLKINNNKNVEYNIPEISKKINSHIIKIAIPFGVVSTGGYLVGLAQVPLLGYILDPKLIPPIYIAIKISQTINGGILQIISSQMPLLTKNISSGKWTIARKLILSVMTKTIILQFLAALFLYYISPLAVILWIGPDNYIGGDILLLFTINYLVTSLAGIPASFVLASGRNPFATSTVLHGVIGLLGMVVLCPKYGLAGVPIAGLISIAVTNLWINPLEGFRTWKSLRKG